MSYALWKKLKSLDYEIAMKDLDINDEMVNLPFPVGRIAFKMFKDHRGGGYDVLYWTYTHTGPGSNKTTYTIWNK